MEKLKKIGGRDFIPPPPPIKIKIFINGPIYVTFYLAAHYMKTNPSIMSKFEKIRREEYICPFPLKKIEIFIMVPISMKFNMDSQCNIINT